MTILKNGIDPLRNPNDPLLRQGAADKDLFQKLSPLCSGYPAEAVIGAAFNLLTNGLRQTNPKREDALKRYDEWTQRFRTMLAEHYHNAGNRKNIFPHEQVLIPPFHNDSDAWKKVR